MGDFYDRAAVTEALFRHADLSQRRPEGPQATGACLYCDEPLHEGLRWCDDRCRDDWQHEQKLLAQRSV